MCSARISKDQELDDLFFYSVPTSVFAIDDRIPKQIRELLTEAEGCLKSNFLTGASACARKIVYELALREKAEGDDYEARVKSLKTKLPHVDGAFFDTLVTVQEVTSEKVHENWYDRSECKASSADPIDAARGIAGDVCPSWIEG